MSKEHTTDLKKFLKPFDNAVIDLVLWLRDFAWDLCQDANELIYDNYNAVALGWSHTDKVSHNICSIAVYRTNSNIHFGFYWGNELSDPEKILLGKGKQYRYILVKDKETFPQAYIKKLVFEAYTNSLSKVKDQKQKISGQTIVKSVSPNRRSSNK
ncbi:MAG: hypothetical protein KDD63_12275 [Bacteroidetes bacterium]|nr:hypothetical protein [Bacteroidota bacterium]